MRSGRKYPTGETNSWQDPLPEAGSSCVPRGRSFIRRVQINLHTLFLGNLTLFKCACGVYQWLFTRLLLSYVYCGLILPLENVSDWV